MCHLSHLSVASLHFLCPRQDSHRLRGPVQLAAFDHLRRWSHTVYHSLTPFNSRHSLNKREMKGAFLKTFLKHSFMYWIKIFNLILKLSKFTCTEFVSSLIQFTDLRTPTGRATPSPDKLMPRSPMDVSSPCWRTWRKTHPPGGRKDIFIWLYMIIFIKGRNLYDLWHS